jgi:cytochrome c2
VPTTLNVALALEPRAYEARCIACHSVAADRFGPSHAGLIGRRAGNVPGFAYSEAAQQPFQLERAAGAMAR